jgi:hypothetical protein
MIATEVIGNKYYCDKCKKNYKTRNSLFTHKKKYHGKTEYVCNFCSKIFVKNGCYKKHIKSCNKTIISNNGIRYNDNRIKNINNGVVANSISIDNNINNVRNEANTNIINNIKIIPLGQENLSEVLSAKEQINILNKRCQALEEIVKYVHFNNNYPQFQNVVVTDVSRGYAYKYNSASDNYEMVKKNELIDNIIENRVDDIDEFYNNHFEKLSKINQKIIKDFINKIISDDENISGKILKQTRKDIEIIAYNNKNIVKNKMLNLKRKFTTTHDELK